MQTAASDFRSADLSKVRLGRYPFAGGIQYYEARSAPYLSSYTLMEDLSKLRLFARTFEDLKARGKVVNTDPRRISRADVEGFMIWMRARDLRPSTREKYLKVLKKYLAMFGNNVLYDMWRENPHLMPRDPQGQIKALSLDEVQIVFDAAAAEDGWRGSAMRAMLAIGFGTGCRPGEILRAELSDLDMRKQRYYVRHPKGEGSWGISQWIPIIRGDVIPVLERFLVERETLLISKCSDTKYLIFNPSTLRPYTERGSNAMMTKLSKVTRIDVNLKDMRPSLCSITIDGDLSRLKAMSLQLRHKSVTMTEAYYARIYTGAIEHEIGEIWRNNQLR